MCRPATQVKLLRVLQEREFERLGGTRTLKVDVRLIAATNQDLRAALEAGNISRGSLLPAERGAHRHSAAARAQRGHPRTGESFLSTFRKGIGQSLSTGISPEAMQMLTNFHWPGNVRELENIIERACALAQGPVCSTRETFTWMRDRQNRRTVRGGFFPPGMTLEQWEDEMIREALRRANGNKSQAARLLGLSRNALRYRLSKIGIADEGEKEA